MIATKTMAIAGIIAAAVGGGAYYMYRKRQQNGSNVPAGSRTVYNLPPTSRYKPGVISDYTISSGSLSTLVM